MTIQQAFELARRHHQAGQVGEAESLYRQILSHHAQHADALHMLGLLCQQTGRGAEGVELLQKAVRIDPANPVFRGNLGVLLAMAGRPAEAVVEYEAALRLNPNDAGTRGNLAAALNDLAAEHLRQDRPDQAIAACTRAITLRPELPEAHYNLANAFKDKGDLDQAIGAYQRAIELKPDFKQAMNNLGTCLKDTARLDEAMSCYLRAEAIGADPRTPDNRLYLLCFHPSYDPRRTFEEHVEWNGRYIQPLIRPFADHDNDRSPDRRLRVGYVSPDFRDHPIGRFLLPVLRNHDHGQFEIFCYSDVTRPDFVTEHSHANADAWRDISRLSMEELAQQVRADRIDILVDLALHLAGNRMLTFARKPAPVQATWLGYPGTTGLETIDYRLTDPHMEPPGEQDRFYTEKTLHLPDSFWCFDPLTDQPPVNELPALSNGFVTLGCLNNFCKVTDQTLHTWAAVMSAVPGSRLLLLAPPGSARQWVMKRLSEMGIAPDRLTFSGRLPRSKYLELHHEIDISLDTFPCNGHTTSFDSLWMGVPVITRPWLTPVSRGGVSILTNLGLTEFITNSVADYARVAAELARDLPKLAELRSTLRSRMRASPVMDAPGFTRNLEAAYRQMWRTWATA